MRMLFFFLFPAFILFSLSSCTLEKRLYRQGWYSGHPGNTGSGKLTVKPESHQLVTEEKPGDSKPIPAPDTLVQKTHPASTSPANPPSVENPVLDKVRQVTRDDPKHMTYREAKDSLDKKDAEPDSRAMTLYTLSLVAIPLFLLGGILGILLDIVILLLVPSTKEKIIEAGGNCKKENLAILEAAQKTALISMLLFLGVLIALMAFLFYLINHTHAIV